MFVLLILVTLISITVNRDHNKNVDIKVSAHDACLE